LNLLFIPAVSLRGNSLRFISHALQVGRARWCRTQRSARDEQATGFTLIELMAVLVIIAGAGLGHGVMSVEWL
jgi:prepilin-type N-terminal cleavage/methylation domain-containing protein